MKKSCDECYKAEIRRLIKESIFKDTKYILSDSKTLISDHLKYHIDNNITLKKNVFRPNSPAFNDVFCEARALWEEKKLYINPEDEELLMTDIGKRGVYNGLEVPLDLPMHESDDIYLEEAEYKGKEVKLNKPKRNKGSGGKFVVYVKDSKKKGKNKIKRVTFGAKGMSVGINDPKRVKSFVARHRCKETNDKTSPRWWSCRLPRYAKSLGMSQTGKKWW
tara:strand:- start:38 stop:697 length:660 start_codon:yes stop_codon:yes gene_type:complete